MKTAILIAIAALPLFASAQGSTAHLDPNELKLGSTTVKIRFENLIPKHQEIIDKFECYVNNPLDYSRKQFKGNYDSASHTLEFRIPSTVKHQAIEVFSDNVFNQLILTSQDSVQTIVMDMSAYEKKKTIFGYPNEFFHYENANSDINNAIHEEFGNAYFPISAWGKKFEKIENYQGYILGTADYFYKRIDDSKMPERAKEYAKIVVRGEAILELLKFDTRYLKNCKKFPQWIEKGKNQDKLPKFPGNYWKLNINDLDMLYSIGYGQIAYLISNSVPGSPIKLIDFLEDLNSSGKIDEEGLKYINWLKNIENGNISEITEESQIQFSKYLEKQRNSLRNYEARTTYKAKADTVGSTGENLYGIMYTINNTMQFMYSNIPIPDENIAELENLSNPIFAEFARRENARIKSENEKNAYEGGYFLHQSSATNADAFIAEILKDMKGKVVLIDFWNTWCMICILEMNEMKQYKPALLEKGVEFIYIANESSPEDTYNSLITNHKGHHYRISENLCKELMEKYHLEGYPSYLIVSKNGHISELDINRASEMSEKIEKMTNE